MEIQVNSLVLFSFLWHSGEHDEGADSTVATESKMSGADAMFHKLAVALSTPEGQQQLADLEAVMQRIQARREVESVPNIPLTPNEEKALAFIRGERKGGRFTCGKENRTGGWTQVFAIRSAVASHPQDEGFTINLVQRESIIAK
jgi:hypothetical protein